jgi:hypothetical protein
MEKIDKLKQARPIDSISEDELRQAFSEAADYVTQKKLHNELPQSGPNSEARLGVKAVEYYPLEAYLKFFDGKKELDPDRSLGEQLKEEIDNMMGNQKRKRRLQTVTYDEKLHDLQTYDDEERLIDITYKMAEEAANGDPDLLALIEAVSLCESYEQISEQLNITIKEVYNLKRKLVRRLQRMKKQEK